jgi:hypothetical protein
MPCLKTPFTDEIRAYQKHVRMARAEVDAGNHRMSNFLEAYFHQLIILRQQEVDWVKKQPRHVQR